MIKNKKLKNKYNKIILIFIVIILAIFFITLNTPSKHVFAGNDNNFIPTQSKIRNLKISLPVAKIENITKAQNRLQEEQERQAQIEKELLIRKLEIQKINNFLKKYKSPLVNTKIPELIYDLSKENNTDYRLILAISGVESGFCIADFNYNCLGYLNGKKYTSWDQAFRDLIPKISRQYTNKYKTNFTELAKAYGMINWEHGAGKMQHFYNQLQ